MRRKLAYVTIDPVNAAEFAEQGRALNFEVTVWEPRDGTPTLAEADVIVHDFDALASDRREREGLAKQLTTLAAECPVAVHGYNLQEHEKALSSHGVIAAARMEDVIHLLAHLFRGVRFQRAS